MNPSLTDLVNKNKETSLKFLKMFFSYLKPMYLSQILMYCALFLANIPIFRVEKDSAIKKLGHMQCCVLLLVKAHLPSYVVFRQSPSSLKGRLSSKVIFPQRSSFLKGCLPSKVVFHQRCSSASDWKSI